jgi:transposase-like protein
MDTKNGHDQTLTHRSDQNSSGSICLSKPSKSAMQTRTMVENLSDSHFQDVDEARKWLEAQRWPQGILCPHCGNFDQTRIKTLRGESHRPGLRQCAECRGQFTVTVGTPMHRSKIPLNKWLLAMHLISASEERISVRQLQRSLSIAYQSAFSLSRRIRRAMADQRATELQELK